MSEISAPPEPACQREGWQFPILKFISRRYREWRIRHQHPFNFAIHLVGIPLVLAGMVLLLRWYWYWGSGAIVLGYVLQYIGHLVEGNDVGEWAAIKKMLGLPYVSISPRRKSDDSSPTP